MSSPPLPVSREMLVRVVSVLDRDQLAEVLVRSLAGLVAIDEAVKTDAAMVAYVGGRGYRRCISLQPGRWSGLSEVEFCSLYRAQLARLDPEQVVKTLADQSGGRPIALLCWERPGCTWCHRSLTAHWLGQTLGLDVPEYDLPGVGLQHPMMAPSLRC